MTIRYLLLVNRQGHLRLAKWFQTLSFPARSTILHDVSSLVLLRKRGLCNILEYKDSRVIYRRYASMFFVAGVDLNENELLVIEVIHRFVECMDKYYGTVTELDIVFKFEKAYQILDELVMGGEMQESSRKAVIKNVQEGDRVIATEQEELLARTLQESGII